ncbi:hypothetical protein J3F84DRAFT_376453 [Trichoderma pleuroticola]
MAPATSHHLYPPFPDGVVTAPLVSISLAELEADNVAASEALFKASKELGFFYLKMDGSSLGEKIVLLAEELHALQNKFDDLPFAEKDQFAREKLHPFFGYRHSEIGPIREDGTRDRNELYNMRKDDIIGNCEPLPCPDLIKQHWELLREYVYSCRAVIDLLIVHLERHLQVPSGMIARLHRITERSGDHIRFNKSGIQSYSEEAARRSEHTDFGTLTILFNWLAGLQIRLQDTEDWVYVRPIPGSAVVNLGDALVKFTAGLLRSNIHRVVPPLPPQDGLSRHSLVYFSRPEDSVVLRRLKGGLIDRQPVSETNDLEIRAEEWIARRSVGDLQGVYTHKGGLEPRTLVVAEGSL